MNSNKNTKIKGDNDPKCPIITAHLSPFTLILRDSDEWNESLESICDDQYNYFLLCRSATVLDSGIAPLGIMVFVDGTIGLPAVRDYCDPLKTLSLFNETICSILLAGRLFEAIMPQDLGRGLVSEYGYSLLFGNSHGHLSSLHMAMRAKYLGMMDKIILYEPKILRESELRAFNYKGRKILAKLPGVPTEQLAYAVTFHTRKTYSESLLNSFTVIEFIISALWKRRMIDKKSIPKSRADFLSDSRSFTTSTKIEVLTQTKIISESTNLSLSRVRKARNNLAHEGIRVNEELSMLSLTVMFSLLDKLIADKQLTSSFKLTIAEIKRTTKQFKIGKKQEGALYLKLPPLPEFDESVKEYEKNEDVRLVPIKKFPINESSD